MVGALLQLVGTAGIDDKFLFGNPQITLFKNVYRRYTNFSRTDNELYFDARLKFGNMTRCKVKRMGDLVYRMFLVIDLPKINLLYYDFTYDRLNTILNDVGINISQLYYNTNSLPLPLQTIVDPTFYDNYVLPYITSTIATYNSILTQTVIQLEAVALYMQQQQSTYNISQYLNPTIPIVPISSPVMSYPNLPMIYSLIQLYLSTIQQNTNTGVLTGTNYSIVSGLYNYLFTLYNTINNNKVIMYNAGMILDIIYTTMLTKLYMTDSLTVNIIPGYSPTGTSNDMHDYIGDNLQLLTALSIPNNDIIILEYTYNDPITSYFSNLIGGTYINQTILNELDVYVNYNLYINEIIQTNPLITSTNNIIAIKTDLTNVLTNVVNNNLQQFILLLQIFSSFIYSPHFASQAQLNYIPIYSYFFPSILGTTSTIAALTVNTDMNLFFLDNNYTSMPDGAYYLNWVKNNMISFFNSLKSIFLGTSPNTSNGVVYEFVPYYTDISYMSYYDMNDNGSPLGVETNLSGILYGQNFVFPATLNNCKLLEMTPFIVLRNLCDTLALNNGSSLYTNDFLTIQANYAMIDFFNFNYNTYFAFLISLYYYPIDNNVSFPISRIIYLQNYLYNHIASLNSTNATQIATHVFSPMPCYSMAQLTSIIPNYSNITTQQQNLLGYIYVSITSVGTLANLPTVLFPLDIILIWMLCDLMVDFTNMGLSTNDITGTTIAIARIMHLYVLPYSDIPTFDETTIASSYYSAINYGDYINQFTPTTINVNINSVHRLSSIWNYISTNQMTLYNNLITTQLLSTTYYRTLVSSSGATSYNTSTNIQSLANTIGVGKTMEQAFELYVSHFYNNRLGVSTQQTVPLENIMTTTNYYTINITDPTNTLGDAINDITTSIINDMTTVGNNVSTNNNLLTINQVQINNNIFYYNTMFNIMTNGLTTLNFNISGNVITLSNIAFVNGSIVPEDGYCAIIYKTYPSNTTLLNLILGEVYNILQIVPIPSEPYGNTYNNIQMPFPLQSNNASLTINQSTLDVFLHINVDNTNSSQQTYCKTLLGLFGIQEVPTFRNITINNVAISTVYEPYISATNITGTLYETSTNNTNPLNYTNSTINNKYWSFNSIYGIIKFLMDMIIYDISGNSTFTALFGSLDNLNYDLVFNNITTYVNGLSQNITNYLSIMTTDGTTFTNSDLYNRLTPLRNILTTGNNAGYFAWSDYIGYNIIDNINITIGGQSIDTHTGTWMYSDYLMNKNVSQDKADRILLGNEPSLTTYNNLQKNPYQLWIPLQFWFNKNFSSAYPLVASIYSQMEIFITLKRLDQVAYWNKKDTYFVTKPRLNGYILANYITLDTPERTYFTTKRHEYLIETIQNNNKLSYEYDNIYKNVINQRLAFTNMCKDLLWICQLVKTNPTETDNQNQILKWTDYTYNSATTNFKKFRINFDSTYREDWKGAGYYNYVQPWEKHYGSLNDNMFLYSFAIFPKYLQPSGAANFSKLVEVSIDIELSSNAITSLENGTYKLNMDVYNKNYNVLRVLSGIAALAFYS